MLILVKEEDFFSLSILLSLSFFFLIWSWTEEIRTYAKRYAYSCQRRRLLLSFHPSLSLFFFFNLVLDRGNSYLCEALCFFLSKKKTSSLFPSFSLSFFF